MIDSESCLPELIRKKVQQFFCNEGRRPRILISSMGAQKLDPKCLKMAQTLAELGFDVDIGPINQTAGQIAMMAIENDVHIICLVNIDRASLFLLEEVQVALKKRNSADIAVAGLTDAPPADCLSFYREGFILLSPSNPPLLEAVSSLLDKL
jgi:methylmalonyl-CoA mutase